MDNNIPVIVATGITAVTVIELLRRKDPPPAVDTRNVDVFICYSHHDPGPAPGPARDLIQRLDNLSRTPGQFVLNFRHDKDCRSLPVGQDFDPNIERALSESRVGVLLDSPAFRNSKYIAESELPRFISRGGFMGKPCLPVGLSPVPPGTPHKLTKRQRDRLEKLERFLLDDKRYFTDLREEAERELFAVKLIWTIERRLTEIHGPAVG